MCQKLFGHPVYCAYVDSNFVRKINQINELIWNNFKLFIFFIHLLNIRNSQDTTSNFLYLGHFQFFVPF